VTDGLADLNSIVIDGQPLLLAETTGGRAVHLIPGAARSSDARPAIPEAWLDRAGRDYVDSIANYSSARLLDPSWSTRTMCGIEWEAMAAGERGLLRSWQVPALAPTCGRCLASLDRQFPEPTPDDRIGLLAVLIAQAVEEHGSAEVLGVPGDQLKALRTAARRELRRRLGHDGKTFVHGDLLLITCDEATEEARLTAAKEAIKAMPLGIPDGRPRDDSSWRLRWGDWSAS
jgi:hypothetical protein